MIGDMVSGLLALYTAPMAALMHLPDWAGHVIVGVQIAVKMGLGGWVLARTGRSPLWILLLLIPYAELAALWVFAYARWPAEPLVRAAVEAGTLPPLPETRSQPLS